MVSTGSSMTQPARVLQKPKSPGARVVHRTPDALHPRRPRPQNRTEHPLQTCHTIITGIVAQSGVCVAGGAPLVVQQLPPVYLLRFLEFVKGWANCTGHEGSSKLLYSNLTPTPWHSKKLAGHPCFSVFESKSEKSVKLKVIKSQKSCFMLFKNGQA